MNSVYIVKVILFTSRPAEFAVIPNGYMIVRDGRIAYCGESIPSNLSRIRLRTTGII